MVKKPINSNYAAIVTRVNNTIVLDNCDNVQAAIILGNQVIVDKSVQKGDIGLYFPLECSLSKDYMQFNNLHRKKELNDNPEKGGFFEENGRVRCQKFRGHNSEGLFMPLESVNKWMDSAELKEGDVFDYIGNVEICKKYLVPVKGGNLSSKQGKTIKESKIIDNQFRFHIDTEMLYRNLDKVHPESLIQVTYKLHGTSGISSYLLCKKPLSKWQKFKYWLIRDKELKLQYDYIYSSRKVIKNPELNPNANHFYDEDIWGLAHKQLEPFLDKGMTFYYEIVGYTPSGQAIQQGFDYGYQSGKFGIYIYRITHTNVDGKIFEFSGRQVQEFCSKNGLNAVPELFYGRVDNFTYQFNFMTEKEDFNCTLLKEFDPNDFLNKVKELYNEKDCFMCSNKVPEEGVVIRIEGLGFEAYKQKSNRFYELETKQMDKGVSNIEEEN